MKMIKVIVQLLLILSIGSSAETLSYQGVIDRIEDSGQAVILIDDLQRTFIVPKKHLPPNSKENMWVTVEMIGGIYKVTSVDHRMTKQQSQRTSELLKRLRKNPRE